MDRIRNEWIKGMINNDGGGLKKKNNTNKSGYTFERID